MDFLDQLGNVLQALFGGGETGADINAWQMGVRSILIYCVSLALIRLSSRRMMGGIGAIDIVLTVLLGSILSRAVNGRAPVATTIVAGGVLVALHWLLALLSFHSHRLAVLLKGEPRTLVRDGAVDEKEMREEYISEEDLLSDLRLRGQIAKPSEASLAILERSGHISSIPRKQEPRVVEIAVLDGVQTVRIEFDT